MQIDNMLRVKVDLIDGKNISNIWSETYDRDLTGKNIFALQDEIIKKIINELVGAGAVLSKDINKKMLQRLQVIFLFMNVLILLEVQLLLP